MELFCTVLTHMSVNQVLGRFSSQDSRVQEALGFGNNMHVQTLAVAVRLIVRIVMK